MTFEELEKKFESDPEFRKEQTDHFKDLLEYPQSVSPKKLASLMRSVDSGQTSSRQAKDLLRGIARVKQDFIRENQKEMLDILNNKW